VNRQAVPSSQGANVLPPIRGAITEL